MSGEFAGLLTERITVERRAGDRDAGGGASGGWNPVATVAAALVPDGTGALTAADALAARPRWQVLVRRGDVTVGDRLGWRGRTLSVRGLVADPRTPDRITLIAEEIA